MRIAYFAVWDIYSPSGVCKKMAMQIQAMKDLGHQVEAFFISPKPGLKESQLDQSQVPLQAVSHVEGLGKKSLFWGRAKALKEIEPKIRSFDPDWIYFRQCIYFPGLRALLQDYKFSSEINTNELGEFKATKGQIFYHYVKWTRKKITSRAKALVCISKEVQQLEQKRQVTPAICHPNGILCSKIVFYPKSTAPENQIIMGFIGSPGYEWHGVDEIVRLAQKSEFTGIDFEIAGVTPEEVKAFGVEEIPKNLKFLGYLNGTELENTFARWDVAFDAVSCHRKGLSDNSTLKMRDYLARGIPSILPHPDPDLPAPLDFILELPNTPENLSLNAKKILHFAQQAKNNEQLRRKTRAFAEAHLDMRVKFANLFKEFEAL